MLAGAPPSCRDQLYHHEMPGENAAEGTVFDAMPRLHELAAPPVPDDVPVVAPVAVPVLDGVPVDMVPVPDVTLDPPTPVLVPVVLA